MIVLYMKEMKAQYFKKQKTLEQLCLMAKNILGIVLILMKVSQMEKRTFIF